MRNLIDVIESFTNDTNTKDAKLTNSDLELSVKKFADEQAKLMKEFYIDDSELAEQVRNFTKESPLNKILIKGKSLNKKYEEQYYALMLLKKYGYSLQEKHHVYSGSHGFDPTEISKDGIFETPAFISASLNIAVSSKINNFHREKEDGSEDHIMHFILPKGYKGCFYLGAYSTYPEELEMIIFPEEKFKLESSEKFKTKGIERHIHTFRPVK